jgi:hypothetical protein
MRFEVHMAVTMKITTFWHETPRSLTNMHQCCSGTCCLHLQGKKVCSSNLRVDETSFPDMLLSMYQTTWCLTPI